MLNIATNIIQKKEYISVSQQLEIFPCFMNTQNVEGVQRWKKEYLMLELK